MQFEIGACSVAPHYCIVLEFVSEGTLSRRLASSTLEPTQLMTWATQIAEVKINRLLEEKKRDGLSQRACSN